MNEELEQTNNPTVEIEELEIIEFINESTETLKEIQEGIGSETFEYNADNSRELNETESKKEVTIYMTEARKKIKEAIELMEEAKTNIVGYETKKCLVTDIDTSDYTVSEDIG